MKKLLQLSSILLLLSHAYPVQAQDLISRESPYSVDETIQQAKNTVEELGMNIIAHIDHGAAAAKNDMQLSPTQVLIFGNPQVGTQLMQDDPRTGLDLPLRVLVWEEKGTTSLSYRDPAYLQDAFALENKDELIAKMQNALQKITQESTQ